jgi:hypothetical protein
MGVTAYTIFYNAYEQRFECNFCYGDTIYYPSEQGDNLAEAESYFKSILTQNVETAYKALTVALIRKQYDVNSEFDLINDAVDCMANALPLTESYVAYRKYVKECKDYALLQVQGAGQ